MLHDEIRYEPIGVVHSPWTSVEDMPVQPSRAGDVKGTVELFAPFVDALADVDRAARGVVWGALANAGQNCGSIERVYVEREIAEGGVVYVHCASGIGRAATLVAVYFTVRSDSPRLALVASATRWQSSML